MLSGNDTLGRLKKWRQQGAVTVVEHC